MQRIAPTHRHSQRVDWALIRGRRCCPTEEWQAKGTYPLEKITLLLLMPHQGLKSRLFGSKGVIRGAYSRFGFQIVNCVGNLESA